MNLCIGGVFVLFGVYLSLVVVLECSFIELLQGCSFENLNDVFLFIFNSLVVSELNNFVEYFIDFIGVVFWCFFSDNVDYDFYEWDFFGSIKEEVDNLFGIFEDLGKEVYMVVYEDLGVLVCCILVLGYFEVYLVEDLVWDNINKVLDYCEDIFNLYVFDDDQLVDLVEYLEESQIDDYIDIIILIGVEFDENIVWGQFIVLELKLLINLVLGQYEEVLEWVEVFLQFNDNMVECNLFYCVVSVVLEIILDEELELDDYLCNLCCMYGEDILDVVVGLVEGCVCFYGLMFINICLDGLEKYQCLIESYKKLYVVCVV